MKPEFKAPPSPAHALIGLLFVLLIPNALYSKVNLPEVPASMIFDVADLIPPRHEAALSLQLRELESKENISIYLVYLEGEPKIRLDKISLYIVERWSSAPIYGLVISYPGYADGFYLLAGGSGVPKKAHQLLKRALRKAEVAAEAEREEVMKLIGATTGLAEALTALKKEIKKQKENPDYGKIEVYDVSLVRKLRFFQSKFLLMGLGGFLFLALITFLIVRIRARRSCQFPETNYRIRFGGKYSGGNNIRLSFKKRFKSEMTE